MQQPPIWTAMPPPQVPQRRSNALLITVLVVLGMCAMCCLGGGVLLWRIGGDTYSCLQLTAQGEHHKAIPPCRAMLAKTPYSGEVHNELGWDLALDGQLPEAVTETRKAVELEPNSTHYDSLAMALALSGQAKEAMKVEKEHVLSGDQPANDAQRLTLGMVYYANGDKAKARQQWELARRGPDPGNRKLALELEAKHS